MDDMRMGAENTMGEDEADRIIIQLTSTEASVPAAPSGRRRAGRPRDPRMEEKVLSAALDAYAETGWSGFNLDVVTRRAGVGKAPVYLRWPTREILLRDALMRGRLHLRGDGGALAVELLRLASHLAAIRAQEPSRLMAWARLRLDMRAYADALDGLEETIILPVQTDIRSILDDAGVNTGALEDPDGPSAMIATLIDAMIGLFLDPVSDRKTIAGEDAVADIADRWLLLFDPLIPYQAARRSS